MSDTSMVAGADGTEFLERSWTPQSASKATIVLVHGLAEHTGRYEHVGDALAGAGYTVVGRDLRGHGGSAGHRAYVEAFSDFLDDLAPQIEAARSSAGPVVLLGHSLGGLIATAYALSDRPAPNLLVLSSPGIDSDFPVAKKVAARLLSRVLPKMTVPNGLKGEQLSSDPSVGQAYFADPLVLTKSTTRLGAEGFAAQATVQDSLRDFGIPTLVIHGGADTIVPPSASAPLSELPSVERHLFPALRHETFNENGGTEALNVVVDWLDRQVGG